MLAELLALVDLAAGYVGQHPDLALQLLLRVEELFSGATMHDMPLEQQRAIASGLAAERARAVQEYTRRTSRGPA